MVPITEVEAAASTSKKPVDSRLCVVCRDMATGTHHNVKSCDTCAQFFDTVLESDQSYSCELDADCEVSKNSRNCAFCWLQKCLIVGMQKGRVTFIMLLQSVKPILKFIKCDSNTKYTFQRGYQNFLNVQKFIKTYTLNSFYS